MALYLTRKSAIAIKKFSLATVVVLLESKDRQSIGQRYDRRKKVTEETRTRLNLVGAGKQKPSGRDWFGK